MEAKDRKKSYKIDDNYEVIDDSLYFQGNSIGRNMWIETIIQNIDTKKVKVIVCFPFNNVIIRKTLRRLDITESGLKKLTDDGADAWGEVAGHYATVLRKQLENTSIQYEHSDHGWTIFQDEVVFRHYKAIGLDSAYDPNGRFKLESEGSYEEWRKVINQEVLGRKWLEFALVLGFVSCLLARLSLKYKNFSSMLVCFTGKTSKGKTASTRLALSPWGLPDTDSKGLLKTWYGTFQGVMDNFSGLFGIPLGIDDTSLLDKEKIDLTEFVYQFTNGVSKQALSSDGSRRNQFQWETVAITSSEESMLKYMQQKGGIRVRYLEVENENFTDSAENAEEIEKGVLSNYGHAGPMFAEYLYHQDIDELYEMFEKTKSFLLQHMEQDSLTKRNSTKLALIFQTAQLVREALKIDIDLEMLFDALVNLEKESIHERNNAEKAFNYFHTHFLSNRGLYFEDGNQPSSRSIGKFVKRNGQIVELRYLKENFEKLLREEGFNNTKGIIEEFKEKGWLIHDSGKTTLTRVYSPGTPRTGQYAIKFLEVEEKEIGLSPVSTIEKQVVRVKVLQESEWKSYSKEVAMFPLDREEDIVQRVLNAPLEELEHHEYEIVEDESSEPIESPSNDESSVA
jgi:putative DNA primase/helicase